MNSTPPAASGPQEEPMEPTSVPPSKNRPDNIDPKSLRRPYVWVDTAIRGRKRVNVVVPEDWELKIGLGLEKGGLRFQHVVDEYWGAWRIHPPRSEDDELC